MVASLDELPNGLPPGLDGVEVRADLAGDLPPEALARHGVAEVSYSLRSAAEGGRFTGSAEERQCRLLRAASRYDVVELEADRDLTPRLLAAVPAHRRRIAWHGTVSGLGELSAKVKSMSVVPAALYLLQVHGHRVEDGMLPLRLLRRLGRSDVTAFADEAAGWSRFVAPLLGARTLFAGPAGSDVHARTRLAQLADDYPFFAPGEVEQLYGIVGTSVGGSLSPRLHNAAYRALGLPAFYLPFAVPEIGGFWRTVVRRGFAELGLAFRGMTVVSPHKEHAVKLADSASAQVRATHAANLLVRGRSGWRAFTTDPAGVVESLHRKGISLAGRRVAVVGCGGAGRGAAAGLVRAGIRPVLVNRGPTRGQWAARLLGLDYLPLAVFDPCDYGLVVHATPVREYCPFPVSRMDSGAVVVDLTYGAQETELVAAARRRGLGAVDGWDVLTVEVERQFRLLTRRSMPPAIVEGLRAHAWGLR